MFGFLVWFLNDDGELDVKVFDNREAAEKCQEHKGDALIQRKRIETKFRSVYRKEEE
jgi:hypothetical protein